MSGGVDSSVSAYLLKKEGYEVIGSTLELYAGSSCCNVNTYLDAKNVCKEIGIPHFIFDCKQEFRECVINDFINNYSNCRTPNPCIECNRFMKFGLMWEKAKEMGCSYIATGHYAKTCYSEEFKRWVITKSNAGKKDQSYVLWNTPKELIEHIVFPLGNFESKEEIIVDNINLIAIDKIENTIEVEVKTRYSSKQARAIISQIDSDKIKIEFDEPQRALTPGQSAVFYIGNVIIGGGKII